MIFDDWNANLENFQNYLHSYVYFTYEWFHNNIHSAGWISKKDLIDEFLKLGYTKERSDYCWLNPANQRQFYQLIP